MPQIEVTFDIDANGILHVSAKDKATGKEQRIVIKASSGLSEEEIKRMVKEAEAHAEEDKRFRELVEARNRGDALMHATEKTLKELGDKVSPDERHNIESALGELKTALAGDDKDQIVRKTEMLAKAGATLAERAYAQAGAQGAAADAGAAGGDTGQGNKDDVVDAEFEEVKGKERKSS
jgi:molecular chaperone DnaK